MGTSPAICGADNTQAGTRQADPQPVAVTSLGETVEHDPADEGCYGEGDSPHDADRHPVFVNWGDVRLGKQVMVGHDSIVSPATLL